jgi:hypothetical protein
MKVYVFGAGVNKAIRVKHGVQKNGVAHEDMNVASPPLSTNFFAEAFSIRKRTFETEVRLKSQILEEESLGPGEK